MGETKSSAHPGLGSRDSRDQCRPPSAVESTVCAAPSMMPPEVVQAWYASSTNSELIRRAPVWFVRPAGVTSDQLPPASRVSTMCSVPPSASTAVHAHTTVASTGHTVRTISRAARTGVVSTFDVPTA
ncbi:MAG TPA: hypothetical protein VGJ59_10920 [Jatrophihabitantaceae bacterium]